MRKSLLNKISNALLGAIYLAPFLGYSQENLVKNGNLEEYSICPNTNFNVYQAQDWWRYDNNGSPEYANVCAYNPSNPSLYTIPNQAGYQLPHSGFGFIHSVNLGVSKPNLFKKLDAPYNQRRESFGGSFIRPLEKGVYKVVFFVNFADYGKTGAYPDGRVATNAFDMLLLNDSSTIYNSVAPYIDLDKVIKVHKENYVINDTVNWVKLSTCFEAEGGERFFAIGAFRDTNEIMLEFSGHSNFNEYQGYYFFDDFSVVKCDTCCFGEFPYEDHLNILSNPGSSANPTKFEILLNPNTTASIEVYDYAGRLVARSEFYEMLQSYTWPPLAEGAYHYVFSTSNGLKENGKVVVLE